MSTDDGTNSVTEERFEVNSDDLVFDESGQVESSERASSLVYKIEWEDDVSRTRQNFQSKVSFGPLEVTTENVDHPEPVRTTPKDKAPIEVITPIWGQETTYRDESDEIPGFRHRRIIKGVAFKDIKISRVGKAKMIIRSQPLLEAIRRCVTYFPSQTLTGDEVELVEPYPVLIHHLDNLAETQRQLEPEYDLFFRCL